MHVTSVFDIGLAFFRDPLWRGVKGALHITTKASLGASVWCAFGENQESHFSLVLGFAVVG
jgi:hypothetical protein